MASETGPRQRFFPPRPVQDGRFATSFSDVLPCVMVLARAGESG